MAIQDRERLRQLVGDYYHGLITVDSYRAQRAELLDNIGAVVDDDSDTVTARRPPAAAKEGPAAEPASSPSAVPAAEPGSRKGIFLGITAVALVAAGYLVVTQMTGTDSASTSESEGAVPQIGLERGDALVEEFLSRNDWSPDSLSNFKLAWAALDDDQRQLATDGRSYRRLSSKLHQRIGEEVALGTAPTSGRLASLVDFATAMGVPYRGSLATAVDAVPVPDPVAVADEQVQELEPEIVSEVEEDEAAGPVIEATEPEPVEAEFQPALVEQQLTEDTPATEEVRAEPVEAPSPEPAVDDPCPAQIANTRRPYCRDTLSNGDVGPALVVLPTGSFAMGNDNLDTESPAHRVEIAYNIAMSRFEITADEYAEFCSATSLPCPDVPWTGSHPVVAISWDDAVLYTEWLSETTGFRYRLPSEAEWEYAARAGTQTPYFFGDEITPSAALSSVNGPVDRPLPRSDRSINRNPYRLYHMSGNVREWTLDAWYPDYQGAGGDGGARTSDNESDRVVRGGSYSDPGNRLRSAAREPLDRSHRDAMTGFRVVREVIAASR